MSRRLSILASLGVSSFILGVSFLHAEGVAEDIRLGGEGTVFTEGPDAFAAPFPGLAGIDRLRFSSGNSLFTSNWVIAPASAAGRDGLGPLFNAKACASCHVEDGRGAPPENGQEANQGLLFRISSSAGHPYGDQLQNQAIPGVPPEASIIVEWQDQNVTLGDGSPVKLRRPIVHLQQLGYGPLPDDLQVSPRLAPPMIGLGLLEAVDPSTLLEMEDPDDKDGDGISGRANFVMDRATGQLAIGRFGWKANQPNLKQQSAGAFLGDMGLTTHLFPIENCSDGQSACQQAPQGGQPEVDEKQLDLVVHYARFLSVPARRSSDDPAVQRGRRLFVEARCDGCHRMSMKTGSETAHPLLANQKIWPYSDLLLHDMGPELADHRPDGLATGVEWRTPPLWGLGLNETVNRHRFFLHDGRARSPEEAILWHGGEAQASRNYYSSLSSADRNDFQAFLNSL